MIVSYRKAASNHASNRFSFFNCVRNDASMSRGNHNESPSVNLFNFKAKENGDKTSLSLYVFKM